MKLESTRNCMAPLDLTAVLKMLRSENGSRSPMRRIASWQLPKPSLRAVRAAHQKGEEHPVVMKVPAVSSLIL